MLLYPPKWRVACPSTSMLLRDYRLLVDTTHSVGSERHTVNMGTSFLKTLGGLLTGKAINAVSAQSAIDSGCRGSEKNQNSRLMKLRKWLAGAQPIQREPKQSTDVRMKSAISGYRVSRLGVSSVLNLGVRVWIFTTESLVKNLELLVRLGTGLARNYLLKSKSATLFVRIAIVGITG